jgi:DNA polymerase/3'-5' exonuclease PolX
MAKLQATEVTQLLEIRRRAALAGRQPYKAKAYMRAAETLRHLVRPLDGARQAKHSFSEPEGVQA